MTVGELRKFVADYAHLEDSVPVLVGYGDHSYRRASLEVRHVERYKGEYYEYFDDLNMSDGAKKVIGVVVD